MNDHIHQFERQSDVDPSLYILRCPCGNYRGMCGHTDDIRLCDSCWPQAAQ